MSMKEAPSLAMAGKALGGQTSKARGGVNMGPNGKRPAILWEGHYALPPKLLRKSWEFQIQNGVGYETQRGSATWPRDAHPGEGLIQCTWVFCLSPSHQMDLGRPLLQLLHVLICTMGL